MAEPAPPTARPRVTLLDYGVGNLRSVRRALEAAGADVDTSADVGGDAIVLPGVGAFGAALERLGPGRFDELRAWSRAGRPLLGICLGMQLLFDESHEHGVHRGLGVIAGVVEPLPPTVVVPHMGWSTLTGLHNPTVYFCHSFGVRPGPATTATTEHGGTWTAAVLHGRTAGFQFHPEKSGPAGIALLRGWIATLGGVAAG
jgi:glutamine amidotransferase